MGGRAITIVLPAPGDTAGAEMAGLGTGCGGFELRAGGAGGFDGAEKAGAMTGFAFGFARMVLTCSMSFALSNGFGICPFAPTAIALAGSMGAPPPSSSTGTSLIDASARTFWQSSYPPSLGMLTSARIRSGLERLAVAKACSPSSTVVSCTSSPANVMLTACWMVRESSARSRVLGMRAASTADAQGVQGYRGRGKLSKPREIASFSRIFAPETREARPRGRAPRKQPATTKISNPGRRRRRNPYPPFRPSHPCHPCLPSPRHRPAPPWSSSSVFRRPSLRW